MYAVSGGGAFSTAAFTASTRAVILGALENIDYDIIGHGMGA